MGEQTKKKKDLDDMMNKNMNRKQMNKQKKENQQKNENNETKKPTNE